VELRPAAFVGRSSELDTVARALADHPPAFVVIEGEAGIGKSRLVHEVLHGESLRDRKVLTTGCPPLGEPFPLGAIVDGLRRYRPQGDRLGLTPLGGALRPLFPEWAEQLPPALAAFDDPRETRHRIFRALVELVQHLEIEVLVVEDLHWADTATVEWLLTLCTTGEPGGQPSIVVTDRPGELPEGALLQRLTSRVPPWWSRVRVELDPLDVEQTRQLAMSMLGTEDVSEVFASFLRERTGGLPLAVEESIRLMRERLDIVYRDGEWSRRVLEELEVPPTVRDSVLERVERIGAKDPAVRQVLQAAAVLRDPADEALLGAVAGLDADATRPALAGALVSGLLVEAAPGQFGYRHVLNSKAVEEAVPVSERRRLHARAGQALQRLDHPPVVRLVRHFRLAGSVESWSRYAEAAAELALEAGDDRTAVAVLLELLTAAQHPADRRVRLACQLAEAALRAITPLGELGARVREVMREMLAAADVTGEARGRLRLLMARLLSAVSEHEAAFAEYETAIEELADRPVLAAPAMLNLAWPLMTNHPASWHRAWLDRAAELLRHVEAPAQRLGFTANRATVLGLLGDESWSREAATLPVTGSTRPERQELALAALNLAQVATVWGHYPEARRWLAAGYELVEEIGYRRRLDVARIARAHLDWYVGDWDGLAGAVAELAESPEAHPMTRLEARLLQALLALAAGARAVVGQYLPEVSAGLAQRAHGGPFILPSIGLARVHLADGEAQQALAATEPDIAMIAGKGVWLWATDVAPVHVAALTGAGHVQRAESFVQTFAAGIEARHAPAPAAALITCRAILADAGGHRDVAAGLFAEAAAAWAALPRPYDELLALEQRGRCLVAAGERDPGLSLLNTAQQRLWQLGARWDADRVARVLRQHDVQVLRTWRRGRRGYGAELSPRELQVVELVARGMTNKQIAHSLFISSQTVRRHVYNSMRKLSVSSRTALAMAAAEAGLLSSPDGR
jgi:DNA-binding CsgD family transcriptional regulator